MTMLVIARKDISDRPRLIREKKANSSKTV